MSSVDNFKEHINKNFGLYEGTTVPLERPLIEAPELNKPKRSAGPSKYVVYVKNPQTGNWACRLPKYAKELGLKGGGNYFW